MLIVYYKLPSPDGEDVIVMEEPNYEYEPAILLTKMDRDKPLFFMDVDVDEVIISPSDGEVEIEPYFKMYGNGFEALLPARNQAEARAFARRLHEHITKSRESEDVGVHNDASR